MPRAIQAILLRFLGLLAGFLLVACGTKGTVIRKWHEPEYASAAARGLRYQKSLIDDEDYCIHFLAKNDTLTLYLPYSEYQQVQTGQTLRLRTKMYTDWNIE